MSPDMIATRRDFLTRGLGLVGIGAALPQFLVRTALAGPTAEADQRITVVLQLSGGHDSLSEIIPYGRPEYPKYRKVTRIPEAEILKLNEEIGFHPNLKGFKELLDQGQFAALPSVGYPNPNYSHFTSTDIWHMADMKGRNVQQGWIGRACDCAFKGNRDPKLALAVGSSRAPLAIVGKEHPGLSFNDPDGFRYTGDRGDKEVAALYRELNQTCESAAAGAVNFVAQTAVAANSSSDQIRELAKGYATPTEYPKTGLARSLRTIAGLIAGGLSTRIYYTFQGGYDTHNAQRPAHDKLMKELNDAIVAFQADLARQNLSKRVLLFTISEFGRRVQENGSEGTDHGAASSLYLVGPAVKAGIHGAYPSLTDLQGGGGGSLKHSVDFRSVYATVLEKWMGLPHEPVLGQKFPLLDCLA